MNLPTTNMHYEDRIKIFNAAQAIEQGEKMMHGLEKWEKNNSWLVQDEYAEKVTGIKRCDRWDHGYEFAQKWNKIANNKDSLDRYVKEVAEEDRIKLYVNNTNPFLRYLFENDLDNLEK